MNLGISRKYLKFFVNNIDTRHVICQGSRRSGKSFSILKWLRFLASGNTPKTILCIAATYPAMQLLIQDFQRATGLTVYGSMKYGYGVRLPNGSRFMMRHFAHPEDAQGTHADIAYIEEALNIPEQVIDVLSMSITEQIYFAYNPTRTSYVDKFILPDRSNFLLTTFKDNPYLSESQIQEFELLKIRAMKPTASILDIYNYKVYYCGEFSEASGKIFPLVYNCKDEDYNKVPVPEQLAIDMAFVDNRDFVALVGVKLYEGKLYAKEYLYSNELANNINLARKLRSLGVDANTPLVADTGGMGKTRCHVLTSADDGQWTDEDIREGFWIQAVKKGRIVDGLTTMNQYEIYVTESSQNLRKEMDGYELLPSGSPKGADHAIDACRYGVTMWRINFG